MIVQKTIVIDDVEFLQKYSDSGYMIERDDVLYDEAIDPIGSNRVYNETDVPILTPDSAFYDTELATTSDYEMALAEFGVKL